MQEDKKALVGHQKDRKQAQKGLWPFNLGYILDAPFYVGLRIVRDKNPVFDNLNQVDLIPNGYANLGDKVLIIYNGLDVRETVEECHQFGDEFQTISDGAQQLRDQADLGRSKIDAILAWRDSKKRSRQEQEVRERERVARRQPGQKRRKVRTNTNQGALNVTSDNSL